jgi:hypothetical protein
MPEILTESFCERCGTRYTFESAAPKQKRLGRFKVLSQGFKNFVMSDDTSLDEALAAARNDEEREAVTQQLDAFHKTFNFCMNCRQYTCSNCWNEVEGRCLTCAPHLGHEVLPAAFPALETNGNGAGVEDAPRLDGLAWPTLDLPPESASPTAELAWPEAAEAEAAVTPPPSTREDGLPEWATLVPDESLSTSAEPEFAPAEPADVETLLAHRAPAPEDTAAEMPAQETPLEVAETAVPPVAAEPAEPEPAETPEPVAAEPEVAEPVAAEPEVAEPVATESEVAETPEPVAAESEVAEPVAETVEPESPMDERVAAASAQTANLLSRFRPGQSIDAALEEYEASLAAQDAAQTAPAETTGEPERVGEPVVEAATTPESAPEPLAAIHETPLDTEPATPLDEVLAEEPPLEAEIAVAITEAAPEPAAPEPAEPEPVAAIEATPVEPAPEPSAPRTPADDRVEVPVWRIVAPDTPVPTPGGQPAETNVPAAATADPQWPQTPAWPGQESQVDVSFLAARLSRKPANDALWAASSRDVVAPLPQQPAAPAVQTCVSCGLSLSATARFCRRCGSRQGA